MLQPTDFEEKQVVIVHSYEWSDVKIRNDNICIYQGSTCKYQISLYRVFAVIIIGEVTITSRLLQQVQKFGARIILLKRNLDFVASIGASCDGNTVLREKQYELFRTRFEAQRGSSFPLANLIVKHKIYTQIDNLKALRNPELTKAITDKLIRLISKANDTSLSIDALRGIEGNASKWYFHTYFREQHWMGRFPRAKCDPINLLLDMGYTYLFHFCECLLRLFGFDVYDGWYHRRFYARESLVCDFIEPYRHLIDRAVRKAFTLSMVKDSDFAYEHHMYRLTQDGIKKYSKIFCRTILDNKHHMYEHTLALYRFVMKYDPSVHPKDPETFLKYCANFPFYISDSLVYGPHIL